MIKLKDLLLEIIDDDDEIPDPRKNWKPEEIVTRDGQVKYWRDGDIARIWDARAVIPQSGFFTGALKELKNRGIKTIVINIQSTKMRLALGRLVKSGILHNPRNMIGISVDEHPSTFDL